MRKALKGVKDPELGLNVVDIGLIYDVTVSEAGDVHITMSLTSPGCPSGPEIMGDVEVRWWATSTGVNSVEVELVWEPYWTPDRMDPRVRAFLG